MHKSLFRIFQQIAFRHPSALISSVLLAIPQALLRRTSIIRTKICPKIRLPPDTKQALKQNRQMYQCASACFHDIRILRDGSCGDFAFAATCDSAYSRVIPASAHRSVISCGQIETCTSPMCAFSSSSIHSLDCPMPPPMVSGSVPSAIIW